MEKNKEIKRGEIVIYKSAKGPEIEVKLEKETIWLTQEQISQLFGTQRPAITKHLQNIFKNGELNEKLVSSILEHTASDGKTYKTRFYNLDAIVSIGYRVSSKRATQFRIWATNTLKKYLVRGYAINEKKLLVAKEKFTELQNAVSFLQKKSKHKLLTGQEREILDLLSQYSKSLSIFEKYDKGKLETIKKGELKFVLSYSECLKIIGSIKKDLAAKNEASEMFGSEVNSKFESIVKNIYQAFGGKELYRSVEEKAAHFLYFTIKDHPFIDGNKRIASFLFVYFLERNDYLYRENGERKINDNALVALALLIAVSDPKDKEVMIKIITNLIK